MSRKIVGFINILLLRYAYKTEFVKFLTLYCEDAGLQTRQSPHIVSIMHRGWSK